MKNTPFVTLLLATTLAACVSTPEQTTQDSNQPITAPSQVQDTDIASAEPKVRKVCKYITPTGSRIGHKICHTEKAWAQMRENAQDAAGAASRPQWNPEELGN